MSKGGNGTVRIKIMLLKAGVTQAQIAREEKVTRSLVNQVIAGHRKNPEIRNAVAQACGISVEELWPDQAA